MKRLLLVTAVTIGALCALVANAQDNSGGASDVLPSRAVNTSTGLSGGGDLSTDRTLTCVSAANATTGCVDSSAQTFGGAKTFSAAVTANTTLDAGVGIYVAGTASNSINTAGGVVAAGTCASTTAAGNIGVQVVAGAKVSYNGATGTTYCSDDTFGTLQCYAAGGSVIFKNANLSAVGAIAAGTNSNNYVSIAGAASGSPITFTASGTNAGFNLIPTGSGGLQVNSGTALKSILSGAATAFSPGVVSVCTDSSAITVTGAAFGDTCQVSAADDYTVENGNYDCAVSASGQVKIQFCPAAAAITPGSHTFTPRVLHF